MLAVLRTCFCDGFRYGVDLFFQFGDVLVKLGLKECLSEQGFGKCQW